MANIPVKEADGTTTVYLKSTGAGSNADPFEPQHAIASGGVESGAVASGAVAAGAVAAGAYVAGALVDGAIATLGTTTDAAIITDAAGTVQQYGRGMVKLAITPGGHLVRASVASGGIASGAVASGAIASGAVASGAVAAGAIAAGAIAAGAIVAGAAVDGSDLTQGVTTGAAVVTDAAGTLQQYARGMVKLMSGTAFDGSDLSIGTTTDAAVYGAGTLHAQVRGILTLLLAKSAGVVGNSIKIEDTTATNVIAADSGPGLKYYVTGVAVTNGHATVGTLVTIQDDEGSPTPICQGWAAPAGGGFVFPFSAPIPTAANAHIHAVCGTTGAAVYVTVAAYIAA